MIMMMRAKRLNPLYMLRDAIKKNKKNYLDRDIVPISSDPPTYETDRDNLDRDNW